MDAIKSAFFFLLILIIGTIFYHSFTKRGIVPKNENKIILRKNEGKIILDFPNRKKIYVRAKVWGVAGNHEEIVFSEIPITIANVKKDYIFYTAEIYYKVVGNTLMIYASESVTSMPVTPFKDLEIILKALKTADEVSDYRTNYKDYELQRVSIYE